MQISLVMNFLQPIPVEPGLVDTELEHGPSEGFSAGHGGRITAFLQVP